MGSTYTKKSLDTYNRIHTILTGHPQHNSYSIEGFRLGPGPGIIVPDPASSVLFFDEEHQHEDDGPITGAIIASFEGKCYHFANFEIDPNGQLASGPLLWHKAAEGKTLPGVEVVPG
jgi:hypothetical protein